MDEVEPAIENLCRERVLLSLNGKLLGIGVNNPPTLFSPTANRHAESLLSIARLPHNRELEL
jgi:hypothetical protein